MISFAILILLIGSFNIWLALIILHSLLTGVARVGSRVICRQEDPLPFWITVASRATAAVFFYFYLVNVISI